MEQDAPAALEVGAVTMFFDANNVALFGGVGFTTETGMVYSEAMLEQMRIARGVDSIDEVL